MPLPPAPRKPATLIDLEAVAKQRSQQTRKKASDTKPVSQTTAQVPVANGAISHALEQAPLNATQLLEVPQPDLLRTEPTQQMATSKHTSGRRKKPRLSASRLFVLDTNVLLHDPSSLFRFDEHDVYLPMVTLEELDAHKKGMSEVSRHARQISRSLDQLMLASGTDPANGMLLDALGNSEASGKLLIQTQDLKFDLPAGLPEGKADNQILGVVKSLQQSRNDREVVLVSKDINMRIKARALGLIAEDYLNDQVLEDTDLLYSGMTALPADFWETHGKGMESWQQSGYTFYRVQGPLVPSLRVNEFVYVEGSQALQAIVREIVGRRAVLQTLRDYGHPKHSVWGITARNREQNFAMNLLMDPQVDFVSLLGQAGTGKTLLALAAGLEQVIEARRYSEIIMTRATVPVGEDIGYLPGTEEEKMQPWMGALEDNLEVLNKGDSSSSQWERSSTQDLIRSRVKVKAMSFMRGRTFVNKFLIVDEAQNLTPKQMKTLITRAGPGTKVICMGNIAQIDTPYLTEGSSGLTYVVDRFKGWGHAGHITLQRGERSRLADFASEAL
ncbi:MAG: PhoH family protein [Betaproteobacteria bacterium]|nr:PhoH family protein [Betaproteobacteria bacterium]NBO44378.1 PhoH family protein [Betaproteobacteria bacterium]NBP09850.1 PhoH family protein [Betaproteobacteria bacterium]NBP61089.1 PhoH family protein [Betaproteobacteria bacterium]NBQ08963.1 PhoH family protein [Betaproteobacteria bacterium]